MQEEKAEINSFPARLKYVMDLRSIKPIDLSNKIGISTAYISQLLTGKRKGQGRGIMEELATALSCSVNWLRDGKGILPRNEINSVNESVDSYDSKNSETEQTEDEAEKARLAEATEIQKKSDDLLSMFRSMVPMMDTNKLMEIGETCKSIPMMEVIIKELRQRIPRDPQK